MRRRRSIDFWFAHKSGWNNPRPGISLYVLPRAEYPFDIYFISIGSRLAGVSARESRLSRMKKKSNLSAESISALAKRDDQTQREKERSSQFSRKMVVFLHSLFEKNDSQLTESLAGMMNEATSRRRRRRRKRAARLQLRAGASVVINKNIMRVWLAQEEEETQTSCRLQTAPRFSRSSSSRN